MTLAAFADLAEVIGALGVIASLIFVGYQLRQNTEQLKRAEANSAMAQASAARLLLVGNRDAAQLFAAGIGGAALDPVDELRLNVMFSEIAYLLINVWDRARMGLIVADEFNRIVPTMAPSFLSARGRAWWARSRTSFNPAFVADLEAALPGLKPDPAPSSAIAPQGAESAVAPPTEPDRI